MASCVVCEENKTSSQVCVGLSVRACVSVCGCVCVWGYVRAKESEGDGRVGGMSRPARI